jgi:twitching motility protein PilT
MNTETLKALVSEGVSDIHFKVGRPPLQRINGILLPTKMPVLKPEDTVAIAKSILDSDSLSVFEKSHQVETSFSLPGFARFRVSIFKQRRSVSAVLRIIPYNVPSLDELLVPSVVKSIATYNRGLVLVTGITGCGKSSTLAGMIRFMNEKCPYHIVTIEDPIEFLHHDMQSSIDQREIGDDAYDFASAFNASLRQDPDVIMVGEMRDLETMSIALRAAETGHLVLSTLHTTDAKETIGRFIDTFPPHQQNQIRLQLAANLRAVISQRLLNKVNNNGRILAAEVMIVTAAIKDFILHPEMEIDIVDHIAKGHDQYGMRTFDQSIMELLTKGLISEEEALANATNANDMRLRLSLK